MKKVYLIAAMCGLIGTANAQVSRNVHPAKFGSVTTVKPTVHGSDVQSNHANQVRADQTVYWQEDFSNGFNGMGTNGAWTTDGTNGDLWFITYPLDSANGYDPTALHDNYTTIPNYFGSRNTVQSETAGNGFAMMDADAYNSTSTPTNPNGATLSGSIDAMLVSPSIDLSGVSAAFVDFTQSVRLCCSSSSEVYLEVSVNGGQTWPDSLQHSVFVHDVNVTVNPEYEQVDITPDLQSATDLSNVKIRFHYPNVSDESHYFWMIDDIKIVSPLPNDLKVDNAYYNDYPYAFLDSNATYVDYYKHFEYSIYHKGNTEPLNPYAEVTNIGVNPQTNVVYTVNFTKPDGSTASYSSDPVTIPADHVQHHILIQNADVWGSNPGTGAYNASFSFSEDADDDTTNNVAPDKSFSLSNQTFTNDNFDNNNGYTTYLIGQGYYEGTPLASPSDIHNVNYIGFCLYNDPTDTLQSLPGEQLYLNIYTGLEASIFGETNPNAGPMYNDGDITYTIQANDLTDVSATNIVPKWIWVAVPNDSVTVPGNTVVMPVVYAPIVGYNYCYLLNTSMTTELYSGWIYDYTVDSQTNPYGYVSSAPLVRFGMESVLAIKPVDQLKGVSLGQNFPNPVKGQTSFEYTTQNSMNLTFEVYNTVGQKVYSRALGSVASGTHRVDFNASNLASGFYDYSITDGNKRMTKTMVVSK